MALNEFYFYFKVQWKGSFISLNLTIYTAVINGKFVTIPYVKMLDIHNNRSVEEYHETFYVTFCVE